MLEGIYCENCGQLREFGFYDGEDLYDLQCVICGAEGRDLVF